MVRHRVSSSAFPLERFVTEAFIEAELAKISNGNFV